MARIIDGTQSVLKGARLICRIVGRFGVARLAFRTSPEFANAVSALVLACQALELVDDFVAQVDRTAGGTGGHDEDVPSGQAQTIENEQADTGSGTAN